MYLHAVCQPHTGTQSYSYLGRLHSTLLVVRRGLYSQALDTGQHCSRVLVALEEDMHGIFMQEVHINICIQPTQCQKSQFNTITSERVQE